MTHFVSRRPCKAPFSACQTISLIAEGVRAAFRSGDGRCILPSRPEFGDIALRFADGEELKGATSEELKG